jgi:hypothetical protein
MSKAYLNKYENGKSQTHHARERANGMMHHSRVREYFDDLEPAPSESAPVIITVPPKSVRNSDSRQPMAQMMLFDQPVTVKLPEPVTVPVAVAPSANPSAPSPARSTLRPPRQWPGRTSPSPNCSEEFTLRGLLRGCGLGLATAAALLLMYLVVA